MTKQLKASSTAEFDSTATGDGTWHVTGAVDAENFFGAMIRSDYACTVTVDGGAPVATLDSLS